MGGFRRAEWSREQLVLWSQRLEDAIPVDHPVRLLDELLHRESFAGTFREWESQYDRLEGQPPYHPRDANQRIDKSALTYDRASDTYRCPANRSLPVLRTSQDAMKKGGVVVRTQYGFARHASASPPPCASCAHAAECCRDPVKGRTINRNPYDQSQPGRSIATRTKTIASVCERA